MLVGRGSDAGLPECRSTITGRVDVTHLLRRGQRRAVRTYLPPGYEESGHDYPVLYMFDGQNLFDRTTTAFGMEWGIDETLEAMAERAADAPTEPDAPVPAPGFDGAIVVGVDSSTDPWGRYAEYSGWDWELGGRPIVADAAATAEFLVDQVLPYVQATYRASADPARVGLAGSSMGGAMTLYLGSAHPGVFGTLMAFSPVLLDEPMGGSRLRAHIRRAGLGPARAYLDMGDAEELAYTDGPAELVADLHRTTAAVRGSVRPPRELVSRVVPGAAHDELAWGARFGEVLLWAFAGGPAPH